MIPSSTDISYFIEIANTLNVSRAAERLGISQPSLSMAIRRLEDSVGAQLLIRSKRGVSLTQAGKQLLSHARNLMQMWEDVRTETQASMQEVRGTYTIGCHSSVGLYYLPRFLPGLIAENTGLDIRLKHDLSRRIAEDVITMKVDVGIVVNPVQHPDLIIQRIATDEVSLWTAPARAQQDVLICDPDLLQSQALMKKIKKAGLNFTRTIASSSLEIVAALTTKGGGIGILPAKVVEASGHKLLRVKGAPVFNDDHCLIYRVENKGVKSVQVLVRAIRDSFEKS
jgi:DNA-binding transcriptional LysR family regulator